MSQKSRTVLDWDDLRYVLALARHKNLSATARALRVTHATVARRIEAAELSFGREFFAKRSDGYTLTKDGEAIVEKLMEMETAALGVGDALVASDRPAGIVRITTIRSFADFVLSEALSDLRLTAPDLTIEILTDMRVLSIAQRDADIALRLGTPKSSDLVGKKVGEVSYNYFAIPAVIETWTNGEPVPLIGYDESSSFTAEFKWLEQHHPNHVYSFRSNSNYAQASAAAGGLGVALLPTYLGRHFSHLSSLNFGPPMPNRDIWLLTRSDLTNVPRVRLTIDHLTTVLGQMRAKLAG